MNEEPQVAPPAELAPELPPEAQPAVSDTPLRVLGRRLRYWSPVFALMLIFGEIAFRGLRPALAESRRLDISAPAVDERFARAIEQRDTLVEQQRARKDPVYQERLRRLRYFPADGR